MTGLVQTVLQSVVGEELSLKGLHGENFKHEPELLQVFNRPGDEGII